MSEILTIEEMRRLARQRIPRMFFDYVDSGSWTESTKRRNQHDFEKLLFRQRVARDITTRSLQTSMLDETASMPLALSPAGMTGMFYPNGELAAVRAAEATGVPFTLSTMSICPMEAVARVATRPFWFQLYVMRDRNFVDGLIDRARAVECSALMVTLDLQVLGQRHADIRNGLSAPPKISLNSLMQVAARPRWCFRMLGARHFSFGNIQGHVPDIDNLSKMSEWTAEQFEPGLDWSDLKRIRDRWKGKLILKGIVDAEDALAAIEAGADAIVISNHGGRQLDGAPSTISALPSIVAAVGGRIEVHLDSGVRTGQDIVRAVALGANAVHVGRPFLYGLSAMGEAGVRRVIEIMRSECDLTMGFCGETDIRNMGLHNLILPEDFLFATHAPSLTELEALSS